MCHVAHDAMFLESWKGDKQVTAFLIRAFADEPITVVISHVSSITNVSIGAATRMHLPYGTLQNLTSR